MSVTTLLIDGQLSVVSDAGEAVAIGADGLGNVQVTVDGVIDPSAGTIPASSVESMVVLGGDLGNVLDLSAVAASDYDHTDIDGNPALPEWKEERVRERLAEVISLQLKARELIASYSSNWDRRRQQQHYDKPPKVVFDNQISAHYTVIDIDAPDDVGLLYLIAYMVDELDLDIHMAIINTVAARAQDAFYVVNAEGQKVVDYERLDRVYEHLTAGLAS